MGKLALIAIGGNSLIKNQNNVTVENQFKLICETAVHVVDIVEQGHSVIITHGNGPQVGFILQRSEIAHKVSGMHLVPLVSCVANTQGALGYQIQLALNNEFKRRTINKQALTVVTQVEVDKDDPSFTNPTKPIGGFYSEQEIQELKIKYPAWNMIWDSGRGYRRVVPSPVPRRIIEENAIQYLLNQGFCVIAAGGGGIPVIKNERGEYSGIDAVIDKDYASSLLASQLKVDLFIISTSVERVFLNYGKPDQKPLTKTSVEKVRKYMDEGHFAPGSMLPKIKAALDFLDRGGKEAIITNPESLGACLKGETGTHIYSNGPS
jgi:carbamate kinase